MSNFLTHFYLHTKTPANESLLILYCSICQYAAVAVETVKAIGTEVIEGFLGLLCKWKTVVLAHFSVLQLQFDVFIDW